MQCVYFGLVDFVGFSFGEQRENISMEMSHKKCSDGLLYTIIIARGRVNVRACEHSSQLIISIAIRKHKNPKKSKVNLIIHKIWPEVIKSIREGTRILHCWFVIRRDSFWF